MVVCPWRKPTNPWPYYSFNPCLPFGTSILTRIVSLSSATRFACVSAHSFSRSSLSSRSLAAACSSAILNASSSSSSCANTSSAMSAAWRLRAARLRDLAEAFDNATEGMGDRILCVAGTGKSSDGVGREGESSSVMNTGGCSLRLDMETKLEPPSDELSLLDRGVMIGTLAELVQVDVLAMLRLGRSDGGLGHAHPSASSSVLSGRLGSTSPVLRRRCRSSSTGGRSSEADRGGRAEASMGGAFGPKEYVGLVTVLGDTRGTTADDTTDADPDADAETEPKPSVELILRSLVAIRTTPPRFGCEVDLPMTLRGGLSAHDPSGTESRSRGSSVMASRVRVRSRGVGRRFCLCGRLARLGGRMERVEDLRNAEEFGFGFGFGGT